MHNPDHKQQQPLGSSENHNNNSISSTTTNNQANNYTHDYNNNNNNNTNRSRNNSHDEQTTAGSGQAKMNRNEAQNAFQCAADMLLTTATESSVSTTITNNVQHLRPKELQQPQPHIKHPLWVRIVSVEHSMVRPRKQFDETESGLSCFEKRRIAFVPVLTIYGSTPQGQKVALHVHKVYPYFMVPYEDGLSTDPAFVDLFLQKLALGIEKAMQSVRDNYNKSNTNNADKGPQQNQPSGGGQQNQQQQQQQRQQFQVVHDIVLVKGIPFYGYYPTEKPFLKIYLYNPQHVSKVSSLLQSGVVLGRKFQPYEAHIPFSLQFFIDYNLSGMGYIKLADVLFRQPLPTKRKHRAITTEFDDLSMIDADIPLAKQPEVMYVRGNVRKTSVLPPYIVRTSSCELEVDCDAACIQNQHEIIYDPISQSKGLNLVQSLAYIWEEEKARRRLENSQQNSQPTPPPPSQARTIPPATPIQSAMRARIREIILEEEERVKNTHQQSENHEDERAEQTSVTPPRSSQHANSTHMEWTSPFLKAKSASELSQTPPSTQNHQLNDIPSAYTPLRQTPMRFRGSSTMLSQVPPSELTHLVDEQQLSILSQRVTDGYSSDEEAEEILNWMRNEPVDDVFNYEREEGEDDDDAVSSQQDCKDILDATQADLLESREADADTDTDSSDDGITDFGNIPQLDGQHDTARTGHSSKHKRRRGVLPLEVVNKPKNANQPDAPLQASPSLVVNQSSSGSSEHHDPNLFDLKIGDCVCLRAPYAVPKPYIAMIEDIDLENEQITVRWFYRIEDTHRKKRGGRDDELFISRFTDVNPLDTVLGKCRVLPFDNSTSAEAATTEDTIPTFYCRYEYSPEDRLFRDIPSDLRKILWPTAGTTIAAATPSMVDLTTIDTREDISEVANTTVAMEMEDIAQQDEGTASPPQQTYQTEAMELEEETECCDLTQAGVEVPAGTEVFGYTDDTVTNNKSVGPPSSPILSFSQGDGDASIYAFGVHASEVDAVATHSQDLQASSPRGPICSSPIIASQGQSSYKSTPPPKEVSDYELSSPESRSQSKLSQHAIPETQFRPRTPTPVLFASPDVISSYRSDDTRASSIDEEPIEAQEHTVVENDRDAEVASSPILVSSPSTSPIIHSSPLLISSPDNTCEELNHDNDEKQPGVAVGTAVHILQYAEKPPRWESLLQTASQFGIKIPADVTYTEPFFGLHSDFATSTSAGNGESLSWGASAAAQRFRGMGRTLPKSMLANQRNLKAFESLLLEKDDEILAAALARENRAVGQPEKNQNAEPRNSIRIRVLTPVTPPPRAQQMCLEPEQKDAKKNNNGSMSVGIDSHGRIVMPRPDVIEADDNQQGAAKMQKQQFLASQIEERETTRPLSPKWDEPMTWFTPAVRHRSPGNSPARSATSMPIGSVKETPSPKPSRQSPEIPTKTGEQNITPSIKKRLNFHNFASPTMKKGKFDSQISAATPQAATSSINALKDGKQRQAGSFVHTSTNSENQHLVIMSIETHIRTRAQLRPDPRYDPVVAIFYGIKSDAESDETYTETKEGASTTKEPEKVHLGLLLLCEDLKNPTKDALQGVRVSQYNKEEELLKGFIEIVQFYDPDIIMGFEIQGTSLGYIIERTAIILRINVSLEASRCPPLKYNSSNSNSDNDNNTKQNHIDEWGRTKQSGIHISGRIVLNLWRIMRSEVKLNIYTLQNVVYNVLGVRIAQIPYSTLTRWFDSGFPHERSLVIKHYFHRVELNHNLVSHLNIVNRTSELARVFGIDFFSVLSRGSQYRVESMMLRLAKPRNYIVLSPSKEQVANQNATECLPLVMEPESKLYTSPVVVLDFQSLYPSIIIAYNICFSTCLGKISSTAGTKQLGALTTYAIPPGLLGQLEDSINVSPNAVMFVKPDVRHGVLPRMLSEILDTRVMVKRAMKKAQKNNDKVMYRILNSRQFGLKMIANVTYGYTSANFSGRMPCSDIADSIVQWGRRTLERAIEIVESKGSEWSNAKVVYGDTDSLFVLLPGASREDAFRIGQQIAAAVTAANPSPIKLQMEKVFHPCILVSKKRYVGFAYESPDQKEPVFDAKGIETVRRDTCKAVASIMEKSLRILFTSKDLSEIKSYVQRQFSKIISGHVNIQDFIFAKEVRLGTYSARGTLPPAALVSKRAMEKDPRAEPLYGERIPFVVVYDHPSARLIDMVMDPHTLINANSQIRLHSTYYITKQIIPALDRLLSLVGVDVRSWYAEMPKRRRGRWRTLENYGTKATVAALPTSNPFGKKPKNVKTIESYFGSCYCVLCESVITKASTPISSSSKNKTAATSLLLCTSCSSDMQSTAFAIFSRNRSLQRQASALTDLCMACIGTRCVDLTAQCNSLDCHVFFQKKRLAPLQRSVYKIMKELGMLNDDNSSSNSSQF